ncbi:unnamed protein product [Symbiodinium sp. CCMP2592]|nr:unnamed protein product [Symbiodinium sp. CCMP2592]
MCGAMRRWAYLLLLAAVAVSASETTCDGRCLEDEVDSNAFLVLKSGGSRPLLWFRGWRRHFPQGRSGYYSKAETDGTNTSQALSTTMEAPTTTTTTMQVFFPRCLNISDGSSELIITLAGSVTFNNGAFAMVQLTALKPVQDLSVYSVAVTDNLGTIHTAALPSQTLDAGASFNIVRQVDENVFLQFTTIAADLLLDISLFFYAAKIMSNVIIVDEWSRAVVVYSQRYYVRRYVSGVLRASDWSTPGQYSNEEVMNLTDLPAPDCEVIQHASTCDPDEVGRDWQLVRRSLNGSFPNTDQLTGTDVSGSSHSDPLGPAFSTRWDAGSGNEVFNEFLFATGDCQYWMIMSKDEVIGSYYDNGLRTVLKSFNSAVPYQARMYRRLGFPEDPWITWSDHWDQTWGPVRHCNALYVGNNKPGRCTAGIPGNLDQGLNVFIRQAV